MASLTEQQKSPDLAEGMQPHILREEMKRSDLILSQYWQGISCGAVVGHSLSAPFAHMTWDLVQHASLLLIIFITTTASGALSFYPLLIGKKKEYLLMLSTLIYVWCQRFSVFWFRSPSWTELPNHNNHWRRTFIFVFQPCLNPRQFINCVSYSKHCFQTRFEHKY